VVLLVYHLCCLWHFMHILTRVCVCVCACACACVCVSVVPGFWSASQ
jgi:hypothetical protein